VRLTTKAIVIHCTATLAHQPWTRQGIKQMHLARGFSDIGYHYLIGLNGELWVGRKPDESIGAHVRGFNDDTLAIAYVGGLASSTAKPTDTRTAGQELTMEAICRKMVKKYNGIPILGHRDLSPDLDHDGVVEKHEWLKECPCFDAGLWAKSVGLPGAKYVNGTYVIL
jgi:N-acetylmuramoyl-L-alanine amidase